MCVCVCVKANPSPVALCLLLLRRCDPLSLVCRSAPRKFSETRSVDSTGQLGRPARKVESPTWNLEQWVCLRYERLAKRLEHW